MRNRILLALAVLLLLAVPAIPQVVVTPNTAPSFLWTGDGTASAPSYSFASKTDTGMFKGGKFTDSVDFTWHGTPMLSTGSGASLYTYGTTSALAAASAQVICWSSGADPSATPCDVGFQRAGAGQVAINGQANGQLTGIKTLTELTTIAAAATSTTAIQIPANAIVLAVSVRVTVAIPTAATFTVTSATPAKTWNTVAVPVALNTTDPGTAPGPSFQTTASVVTITPNLTPGTAVGRVRVTIHYIDITPPTS